MKLQFPPTKPYQLTSEWLQQHLFPRGTYNFIPDIPYLGQEREEKLDAYLPLEGAARPVPAILLIHGGGWRIGDKADRREQNIGQNLAAAGYAVFSINYALNRRFEDGTVGIAWPQNYLDCKSGLRFLREYADVLGIDPDRIATMGGSAGGHLSMLLGATPNHPEMNQGGLYTSQSNAVKCVLNFYGVPDVRDNRAAIFAGSTPEETLANATAASPVTYFGKDTPPTFITHGTADATVPVEKSRALVQQLKAHQIPFEYIEIPDAPHTYHLQPEQMDLRPAVLAFLAKYL